VIAEFEAVAPQGGVSYESRGDLHGEWDGDRIAQALSNLVRNAIQHGSRTEKVSVVAAQDGEDVTIAVHNKGPTIPPASRAKIFEPMVRNPGADESDHSLGLGLYIASQIAIAHGGEITVASSDADGTTFAMRIPRTAAHEAAPSS
jgi:signal transduction histidine kinase